MWKAIVDGFLSLFIYFMAMLILSGDIIRGSYSKRQMYAVAFIAIAMVVLYLIRRRKSVANILYYILIGFLMVGLLEFGGKRFLPLAKLFIVFFIPFAYVGYREYKQNEKLRDQEYIDKVRATNKDNS